MKSKQVWAVVPAAGIGARMNAGRPKQYLELENKPVIVHTLERLASHPDITGIVVAIMQDDPYWSSLDLQLDCALHVVDGGDERAESVLNALQHLSAITDENPWVMVHDAARPCIRHQDLDKMLSELCDHDVGGILGVPVNDTVKRVDSNNVITETVCRKGLWRASTPQMFRLQTLQQALRAAKQQQVNVTDDASAIEAIGLKPLMVEGHADNIKITLPADLALAALFMQQQRGGA